MINMTLNLAEIEDKKELLEKIINILSDIDDQDKRTMLMEGLVIAGITGLSMTLHPTDVFLDFLKKEITTS